MNRLYFGIVAPVAAQEEQVNGGGFLWRYKVRIHSVHPPDKNVLPDDDLPWAQVLLPVTAGSGAANYATSPAINVGDTVAISYLDEKLTQPVITGVLPRTEEVSQGEPDGSNGYIPSTGFTERRDRSSKTDPDESNESSENSQVTTPTRQFSNVIGDVLIGADSCDPNAYKTNAVISEVNNLFNQISRAGSDTAFVESVIQGAVDRVHSLVNSYVGDMFNNVFNSLIPVLNAGLRALYEKIYGITLAATQNPIIAREAAEAALTALIPAVQALQEAISLLAAEVVSNLLGTVDDLIRDAVDNNQRFNSCAGTQVTGALVNAIIQEIERGLQPLLNAVVEILTGGFSAGTALRSSLDVVRDFSGGLLSIGQSPNKCGGLIREYSYGAGPQQDVGDILQEIIEAANTANSLVSDSADNFAKTFGDFPVLSSGTDTPSQLQGCSTSPDTTCFPPEISIFGGRGQGARARAVIGEYTASPDPRTVSSVTGGVVAIEILNGGSGYVYPPFVQVKDNCGLGIGADARAVIKDGKVERIYIVQPGENYPSYGEDLFVVDNVEVVNGGSGYEPGIVEDQYGGQYEIITDENGTVTDVLPINIVQVPTLPTISVPKISPEIPPGGRLREGCLYDANGNLITCNVKVGNGLNIKPLLIELPPVEELQRGNIPPNLAERISQEEIQQIIDCVQN